MRGQQKHYRACNFCEAMCGVEITHDGQQILSIKGDKDDPLSKGYICPKATALQDLHEDPDRLRRPIERTAEGWREISWEQALDKAAEGIKHVQQRYGNDALATYLGNPNVHNAGAMLMGRHFHNAMATRHRYSATSVDQLPHHIVCHHLFGHQLKIPVPDIDHCQHMLIIGGNPLASNGSIMSVPDVRGRLKSMIRNGGKVVVIDPRRTETAEMASEHHFVRPGSDVLLLLAMVHVLFRDQRVQVGRLADSIEGLDKIESLVADYPPGRVASLVGIDEAEIGRLVTEFCAAEAAVCYGRMGVSVQRFGLFCQYLIMLFNILSGRLDEPGGMMFPRPAADPVSQAGPGQFSRERSRVRGLPKFSGEYPVATLAEEILTPGDKQIKALVVAAGNPVLSTPNGEQLQKAIQGLEFMLSIDFYINETNQYADLILPPVSPLEREHFDLIFHNLAARNTVRYAPALFAPPREAKHDWQIYLELEKRLRPARGLKNTLKQALQQRLTPRRLLDLMLRTGPYGGGANLLKGMSLSKLEKHPHGIDLGELKPCLPQGLRHRDKKLHLQLDFYFADLVRVEQQFFSGDEQPPFLLIGRRHVRSNNSWLHNSHRLVKGKPRCTVQINPGDAARLAISDGQRVAVSSRVGRIEIEAELSDNIMPGVLSIPHGWGHNKGDTGQRIAMAHAGVSVNDLTDESMVDELSGNAALNGVPVSLCAIDEVGSVRGVQRHAPGV